MILSMTGFGKAEIVINNKKITAEVKSLNSKQLDLSVRLPQAYREVELKLRNDVSKALLRGKVDLYVYSEAIDGASAVSVNLPLLKIYKEQIEKMSEELGIQSPTDWHSTLLRLPDALKSDVNTDTNEEEIAAVSAVVANAVNALLAFRTQEGDRLCHFFEEKIAKIQQLLNDVASYEESRIEKIKARILDSLVHLENVD